MNDNVKKDNSTDDITLENLSEQQQKMFRLITRNPTEEVLTDLTLIKKIADNEALNHYIGFEVSGFIHLGTGLVGSTKIADFQAAGVKTRIFLADYHTMINNKLGGDLDTIRRVAGTYFKEALRLSLECVGGNTDKVEFILGSELYEKLNLNYWEDVIKIAKQITLNRAKRSITILGRREGDAVSLAQLMYVPMQVADLFSMKINLPHAGMDQRKAHVVALDVANSLGYKPVAVHHHLLMGVHVTADQRSKILAAKASGNRDALIDEIIDVKMSKSKPNSAVYIHDTEEQIKAKIMGAFCPAAELEVNSIIDIERYIIWPYLIRKNRDYEIFNAKTKVSSSYKNQKELEEAYVNNLIHPVDLKDSVSNYLIEILGPARKYFLEGAGKKYLEDMQSIQITR